MASVYGHLERVLDAGPFGRDWRGSDPWPEVEWSAGQQAGFERVRARCDRALQVTKTLPDVPQRGESVSGYQRRLLQELKQHTVTCRGYDFNWGTPEKISEVEPRLLSEAVASAKRRHELAEVKLKDRSGRTISEFEGDKNTWLNEFRGIGWQMNGGGGRPLRLPAV